MDSNEERESEEWICSRCTSRNHRVDQKCFQCLTPRIIAYPTVPANLPIPDITHPFSQREFTNLQGPTVGAHAPKRREVPPNTAKKKSNNDSSTMINQEPTEGPETNATTFNAEETLPQQTGISMEDMPETSSMTMNFDPSSSLPSMANIYDQGSDKGSNSGSLPPINDEPMNSDEFRLPPLDNLAETVDIDEFRLPPLPGFEPNAMTSTTSPIVTSSQMTKPTTSSSSQQKTNSVDDLLEQSAEGFQRSDFRQNSGPDLTNLEEFHNDGPPAASNTPLDLSNQDRFKPPETSANLKISTTIPALPRDVGDRSFRKPPGMDKNVSVFGHNLPPWVTGPGRQNQLEQHQTGMDWKQPRVGLEAANPLIATRTSYLNNNVDVFPTPSGEPYSSPNFGGGGNLPPMPQLSMPPGLRTPSTGRSSNTNMTQGGAVAPSEKQQPVKIKPTKSNKPVPDLGRSKEIKTQLSNNDILSLYDPNGEHVPRTTSEPVPEVASMRSAVPLPPGLASNAFQLDDQFFDPYAPAPKPPLEFKDEHFGEDSDPVQERSQNPPTLASTGETVPTSTSTMNVVSGGARRKTPRTQAPTATTQTQLYTGPSTSRGPPLELMSTDNGTWPCPLCTYANRITAQYCEICHDGRPPWYTGETASPMIISNPLESGDKVLQHGASEPKSKAFVDEWVCQICTESNEPRHRACRKCGNQRPSGFVSPSVPEVPLPMEAIASITQPKRMTSIPEPTRPSTSQQVALPIPELTRQTSATHNFNEELQSLRVLSVGSVTSSPTATSIRSIALDRLRMDQGQAALEIFKNIETYCQQADDKFVDDQFLPSVRSLQFPNGRDPTLQHAIWLRPHQIKIDDADQHRRWTVFCDEGPNATDIQQGILGNCWFLSGLSVLVERPYLLRKIFTTSEYSKYGAYMIRLCKDGVWQTVIIDDLLPCGNDGTLLYTQAKRKQLWVPLIEKALAKVHGCYEALQAGRSIEGLATLTGAPCESLQLVAGPDLIEPEPDLIWVRLLSAREAGYLMGASCGGANMDVDETIYNEVDLRVRHAYSVLDVRTEIMDNGGAVKLLQLRNPWAQQSWSGDWSDRDIRWHENPRMRAKLNPAQSSHGIFWLCFDDMLRYFDSVDICKIRDDNWTEIRTEGDFPDSAHNPPASFFLEVFQSTEIDLSIFQQGSRSQEGSGRHPVDLCICVFRSSEQASRSPAGTEVVLGPLVVCSRRQVKRHGSCSHFFEPGIYQVVTLAFNHWMSAFGGGAGQFGNPSLGAAAQPAEHPKFVLALHSSRGISLSPFKANVSMFADATIELVMKRGEKKEVRECATCYYLTRGWAGLIVVAENRHPTRHMQIVCDCIDSRNVVSTRGVLKTGDSVPPLHKQVLIVLTQLDGHSGFTITHKLVHRMGSEGLADWSPIPGNHDPPLAPDVEALHKPRPL